MPIYYVEITELIENSFGEKRIYVYYMNSEAAQKQFIKENKKDLQSTCLKRITKKGIATFNINGLLCPISW